MTRSFRVSLLAAALAVTASAFAADQNTFMVVTKGKPSGRASYTIDTIKDGYRVRSHYEFHVHATDIGSAKSSSEESVEDAGRSDRAANAMNPTGLIDGQVTSEYRISSAGLFLGGYISDATQTLTSFSPDKNRTLIIVNRNQAGAGAMPTEMHAPSGDYTFLPEFDPAAIQALLLTATAHPHPNKTYMFLVPALNPRQMPTLQLLAVDLAASIPATGELDGKPITLKHYVVKFRNGIGHIYTDEKGSLMEADIDPLSTSYVRTKFVLGK
jgi:hypothetical protein